VLMMEERFPIWRRCAGSTFRRTSRHFSPVLRVGASGRRARGWFPVFWNGNGHRPPQAARGEGLRRYRCHGWL